MGRRNSDDRDLKIHRFGVGERVFPASVAVDCFLSFPTPDRRLRYRVELTMMVLSHLESHGCLLYNYMANMFPYHNPYTETVYLKGPPGSLPCLITEDKPFVKMEGWYYNSR